MSRSGFYDWLRRPPRRRQQTDAKLLRAIGLIHQRSRGAYGADKTWCALKAQGVPCGRHRVARLRRENGIVSRRQRRFRTQRAYCRRTYIAPNRLNQRFDATTGADQIWAGDVTFIPTRAEWLYLAIVIDLHTRQIVGWEMSARPNRSLVCEALSMAVHTRQPQVGLLHHTDQGSVYASEVCQSLLQRHGIQASMSRTGNCYDNAVAESFFSTLKNELTHGTRYATRADARSAIFDYIEVFYLHQGLNYQTPLQAQMSAN